MAVKAALHEEFGVKQGLQKVKEDALLLKLLEEKSMFDFALKVEKVY